jgi:hypothetical protein
MQHRVLAALVAFAVSGVPVMAFAQDRDPVAAEALFRAGRDAVKAGDYASACPKFADSYRLDPSQGTLLNLADCEEHVGKIASAWQRYQSLKQNLQRSDERYQYAIDRIKALEPRLPRVTIALAPDAPKSAKVFRDGSELGSGSLGFALPMDPGKHDVRVSAAGYEDKTFELTVKEAEIKKLEVNVGKKLPEAPIVDEPGGTVRVKKTPNNPKPVESDGRKTAGFVSIGIGGAALIFGGVTGFLALDKKSKLKEYGCANDDFCENDPSGKDSQDAAESGRTFAALSTVGFAVGAVGVGLGTYLILSSGSTGETQVGMNVSGKSSRFVLQRSF